MINDELRGQALDQVSGSVKAKFERLLSSPGISRPAPQPWNARYEMLDGWRGIAAIAVVFQHVSSVRVGHVAVMLFFVISGYCIAASATSCVERGYGFRRFMLRRVRRIYPPYLLAVAYFAATRFVKLGITGTNQFNFSAVAWIQNLTLTQWLSLINADFAYAADNPVNFVTAYWSLNYEEQFYLVVALFVAASILVRNSIVVLTLPLLAVALLWNILHPYRSYGTFIDYWPHFGIGLLVFVRLCRLRRVLFMRLFDALLIATAIFATWWAWFAGIDWYAKRPLALELLTVSAFALLLLGLRPFSERLSSLRVSRLLMSLGAISYSLYLVHQCNIRFAAVITALLVPRGWFWPSVAAQVAIHVVLAIPFYIICERPFRNRGLTGVKVPAGHDQRDPRLPKAPGGPIGVTQS